jgi:hypothetical protein
VAHDVENDAVRIGHEEALDTPWLGRQGVHNLETLLYSLRVGSIHVFNLDRDLRLDIRRVVASEHSELRGRIRWGNECDDPTHVHADLKTKEVGVEIAALVDMIRFDVRHDSSDVHGGSFFETRESV